MLVTGDMEFDIYYEHLFFLYAYKGGGMRVLLLFDAV